MTHKLRGLVAAIVTAAVLAVLPAVALADDGEGAQATGQAETAADGSTAAGVSMYRLYNPYSSEHFYTADSGERDNLIAQGWSDEGIGWTAPAGSKTPVYRLYNAYAGEHHYMMDAAERDTLVAAGWNDEGVGWFSDDAQGVPLHREYNPYEFANNHNYTTSDEEHDALMAAGWRDEGYAWYGIAASEGAGEAAGGTVEQPVADDPSQEQPAEEEPAANIRHANVKVQGYDEFTIDVDLDNAPITAANFCKLVEDGYYDGLAFYRIQQGFCLQGGTLGNNAAGNDPDLTPIVGEFRNNGHDNPLADRFHKGTVAMARTNDPDSATSTFFVTLETSLSVSFNLNGKYAAFGTIDAGGMKIVDAICSDYAEYATGDAGAIDDSDHMPIIEHITMAD